jgi:uncharacterized membrane protein
VGVENVNSDLATFIRTVVILFVLGGILMLRGLFQPLASISGRTYLFLTLSGASVAHTTAKVAAELSANDPAGEGTRTFIALDAEKVMA